MLRTTRRFLESRTHFVVEYRSFTIAHRWGQIERFDNLLDRIASDRLGSRGVAVKQSIVANVVHHARYTLRNVTDQSDGGIVKQIYICRAGLFQTKANVLVDLE